MPTDTHEANTALAALLAELGWGPERLARRLNHHAAALGHEKTISVKSPYRWRDHRTHPREPWPALVAAVLSDATGRTITPAHLGWRSRATLVDMDTGMNPLPWTSEGAVEAMRMITEQQGRREFLASLGAAALTAQRWLVTPAVPTTRLAPGTRSVTETVVDQIDNVIAAIRSLDDLTGGGALRDVVHAHLTHIHTLLAHGSYTDTVERRLHTSAGELLRLAGWLAFDSGAHGVAQRYWTAALRFAHTAGDTALGANIVGFMSCQAKDQPSAHARQLAVTLADTAVTGYRGSSPRVTAILQLRAAEALAGVGASIETRHRIDRAFSGLAATPPAEGDPAWSYWMDRAHAHAQAGFCHWRLGNFDLARHHLSTALRAQGPRYTREAALRQILLARTYLRQRSPDRDQALDLAARAITTLETGVDSSRCVGYLTGLAADLARYRRHGPVDDLTHRATRLTRHQPSPPATPPHSPIPTS